jgi:hypothetical protein
MHTARLKHVTLLAILLISSFLLLSKTAFSASPKIGINVSPPQKMTSSIPFTDIFKLSTGWVTSCDFDWQNNRPVDPGCTKKNSFNTREKESVRLDANGWVQALPSQQEPEIYTSVSSVWTLPASFPTGAYVVLYEGEGTMAVRGDVAVQQEVLGRIDFTLNSPKRNLRLHITATDPKRNGNYIRNIRVIPKEYEFSYQSQLINPRYAKKIGPFQVLRFMPWQQTVYQQEVSWNTRPKLTTAHYNSTNGVPLEAMLDLSNQTRSIPWFSIPHKANDNYVHNFANLVKQKLAPGQQVYIELSNEVWNMLYSASHYANQEARLLWPRAYPKMNPGTRKILLAINWYAKRSAETCDIFRNVFGGQKNRVVCVVSTYAGAKRFAEELLDCPLWNKGYCGKHFDAFAVGPYFGDYMARIENRNTVNAWVNQPDGGMNSIFKEIFQGGLIQDNFSAIGGAIDRSMQNRVKHNVALAKQYGIPLIAYEGGQHLLRVDPPHTVKDPRLLEMFMNANRDPRMKQAYQRYLQAWKQHGGGLFVHFYGIGSTDSRNYFSMLEHVGQATSPKYQALLEQLR